MAKEKQEDELYHFNQWQKTQDPKHFQTLYKSMKPLLETAASKASMGSNIPKSAHQLFAAQNFYDSLRTFDPKKGVALQTHVYGTVHQKAKRLNYQYQNLGQIPEPRAIQIGKFQTEYGNLTEELGREPSAAELADRMSVGLKDVERLQIEIRKDFSMSGLEEQIVAETPREEEVLAYIYYELTPEEKVVYDYIFGKHGKQRLVKRNGKIDFDAIALRTKFSTSKVRSLFVNIRNKFEKASR